MLLFSLPEFLILNSTYNVKEVGSLTFKGCIKHHITVIKTA